MKRDLLSLFYEWFQADFSSAVLYLTLALMGALAFLAFFLAFLLLRRRTRRSDMDSILRGTEELLRGNFSWRIEATSKGPLFKIASNINQLASDFKARTLEAEGTRDHYYHLVESLEDYALLSTNLEWDIISFNRAALHLFGWNAEELKGKSISILFSESFWISFLSAIAKKELLQETQRYQPEFRKKTGEFFSRQASIGPLKSKSGEAIGYLIAIQETSEGFQLERALRESEERYRSLVEELAEGVFILQEGKIVYANEALCSMLHLSKEDLIGKPFKDFILSEDLIVAVETLKELEKEKGRTQKLHLRLHDPVRLAIMDVLFIATSISYQGKMALIGSLMDVTESRRIEREIKRHEGHLDATLDSVSEGLMMIRYTERGSLILLVNKSFELLFGIRSDQIVGRSLESVQEELSTFFKDGSKFLARMNEWRQNKGIRESVLLETVGMKEKILECLSVPVGEKGGEITGRIFSFRDVTGQKEFEEQLKENVQELERSKEALEKAYQDLNAINQELQIRTKQLDQLNEELRALDEMKTKLLTNVSHELQTPLVSIKGYTEMILKGKLGAITEEQEKGLQVSLKNIERLIHMIDNLLSFSQIERGEKELKKETFPIWQLIDESIELVKEKMEMRDISITTQYHTDELMVLADRSMMAQVFINLLSNAIKFNRQGGTVSISVRKGKPGFLLIDIKDTGIGISQEDLPKIFNRFFRVAAPSTKAKGTGIGLSIVKDLLMRHQCTIDVQSKIGEGSTFSFTLPMAKGQQNREDRNLSPGNAQASPGGEVLGHENKIIKDSNREREDKIIKIKIVKRFPQDGSL